MVVDKNNVAEYLRARHLLDIPAGSEYSVEPLGGGFLNTVLRVRKPDKSVIVKQALDALRLFPDLKVTTDRIVYEYRALTLIRSMTEPGTLPEVYHFDDANRILVMEDLGDYPLLEQSLIQGRVAMDAAETLGAFLARLHRGTWEDARFREEFDNEAMQQLRLKYCFYFVTEPALQEAARRLGQLFTQEKRTLLHGDFWTASVMTGKKGIHIFDFEFTCYGHPAQDAGFMMAHYLLHAWNNPAISKEIHAAVETFWKAYRNGMDGLLPEGTERAALQQAGIEMLFRIDGINPVKYITDDKARAGIRMAAKRLILDSRMTVSSLKA